MLTVFKINLRLGKSRQERAGEEKYRKKRSAKISESTNERATSASPPTTNMTKEREENRSMEVAMYMYSTSNNNNYLLTNFNLLFYIHTHIHKFTLSIL